jgi:hypothetical protein
MVDDRHFARQYDDEVVAVVALTEQHLAGGGRPHLAQTAQESEVLVAQRRRCCVYRRAAACGVRAGRRSGR